MEYQLCPSILSADFNRLGEQIREIERNGVKWLHFDVMDGHFVPNISFGIPVLQSVRKGTDLFLDVHLMIENPGQYIGAFAKSGADLITFHYEAVSDVMAVVEQIHAAGCRAGVSLKPGTDIVQILPYLADIDLVLIMTVEPGFGGQSYIEASTERIRRVRSVVNENNLATHIEVDGGINKDTLTVAADAGANIFVEGSAVFGGDIAENIREFNEQMEGRQ